MNARFPVGRCERCGALAPCMRVTLFQNVGAVVLRFTSTVSGMLCKRCIDAYAARMSAISFFFGWWGVVSFFVNAVTLPMNIVTWVRSLSLPDAPPGPGRHDPYVPATAAPARSKIDVLAILELTLGGVAILITLLFAALGVGMMVAPAHPDDPRSGLLCLILSAVLCGLPGVIGFGAGLLRLRPKAPSR